MIKKFLKNIVRKVRGRVLTKVSFFLSHYETPRSNFSFAKSSVIVIGGLGVSYVSQVHSHSQPETKCDALMCHTPYNLYFGFIYTIGYKLDEYGVDHIIKPKVFAGDLSCV